MTEAEIREVVRSEVREFVRRVVAVVDLTTTLQGTPMAQARAKLREAIEAVGRYDTAPNGGLHPSSTSKPGGLVCARCGRSDGTFEAWGSVVTHSPCEPG